MDPMGKGKSSEPNLHEDMFHVNLQACTFQKPPGKDRWLAIAAPTLIDL